MLSISSIRASSRTTALTVALLAAIVGMPGIQAAEGTSVDATNPASANAEIQRLQTSLTSKDSEIEQLRQQLRQMQQAAQDVLPSVTPMASGRDSGRTLALAPSSSLTDRMARAVARTVTAQIPGSMIVTVQATGSMRPLFNEHALLVLESVPFDSLKLGDIVTYEHPRTHTLVVHRLLEKHGDEYWAKGDHNGRMDDAMVTRGNFRMRVCGIIYENNEAR